MTGYLLRLVDPLLEALLAEVSAVFVAGPRAAGKTTTALRLARTTIRLDRAADSVAFRADPDAAVRGLAEPILLDEWQVVPGVLGAVKRSVDAMPRPGRFIVTGSVRGDIEGEAWPGTGRLVRVPLLGLTVREQVGRHAAPSFFDRLVAGERLGPAAETPDLRGYVDLMLRSGFPEAALRLRPRARRRWLESYVEHIVTRDAEQVDGRRDPVRLRRFLEAYALNTAGVVDDTTLLQAAGINRRTAAAYELLLGNLLVAERMPAWTTNRLKRLTRAPKRLLLDAGLAAALLGLDENLAILRGDLLGRLLETFVVAQLRAEATVAESRPRLHHLRQQAGRGEIDVVAELSGGRLVAIEVKADAAPTAQDARHLATLRDRLPELFLAGLVLHTGPRAYDLGDRIRAVPISTLWS